jgi:tRNA pseudouridine55 synthase
MSTGDTKPLVPRPDGFLVVHKPTGWTSSDVVGKVRGTLERHLRPLGHRFSRRSRLKVGHGGTLDPMATGVLVLGIGTGCRRLQEYLTGPKSYTARAVLGSETDTQDAEGKETRAAAFDHVSRDELVRASCGLTGTIMQRPPIYSALRKDGKRLYELARAGEIKPEEVEKRQVTVHRLDVGAFDEASGEFDLGVRCSGGTYVRTLIEELGRAVGSAAHMTALERTQHGPFCASSAQAELALAEGLIATAGVSLVVEDEFGDAERLLASIEEAAGALEELRVAEPEAF